MSENRRYYWLKLQETFFEDDTIDFIESQENGEKYVLFYLKLCLKALKNEGKLIRYVGELLMPYDEAGIAKLTKTDIDTVRSALILFTNIGLIKRLETGEIYLTQINELIGTETADAQRKRRQRINEKAHIKCDSKAENVTLLAENVTFMSQEGHTDIDIELDKELDIKNSEKDNSDFPEDNSDFPEPEDCLITQNKSANADDVKTKHKFAYSIYTHHHSRIYNELRQTHKIEDKPVDYNYGLIAKRMKKLLSNPYFTEEKILQGITNAQYDPSCLENGFILEQMLTEANLTRLINKCYISTSAKKNYNIKVGSQVIHCDNQNYDEKF